MENIFFDLTPDPKVLIALTHTPMQPLDALCELIDNSIDSFKTAKLQGYPVNNPIIEIELPKKEEIENNCGVLRIRDNGPGLTDEAAERSIRAGYSGNNPYDNLGLFGMGFNISTGKLGISTKVFTTRIESDYEIEVPINLQKINEDKNYKVCVTKRAKRSEFQHGTIIEISKWWPEGNSNRGFVKKLVQYGYKKVREELGRRYATILRKNEIRIFVNAVACEAFEHCVWDDSRFVERKNYGKIPAVFRFNEVIDSQKRCASCRTILESEKSICPSCNSTEIRTIEERIEGWVGIQRFDDLTFYGVDLIRNGRAIRISEQQAFFLYVDEFQKIIKDYPIDTSFGRIVGEVHLNHVPVDFLKQDFQRSSAEWQRAISYLRGDSSLQPTQPGADKNKSPIYKLYQGYRRMRVPGKTDMYMGYWDVEKNEPKRISRDIEKEFYEKFKSKEVGFYDDLEWWKKVEEAELKPVKALVVCPECGAQNIQEQEECSICGFVFKSKNCLNEECKKSIPFSAQSCPHCGESQVPKILESWKCDVCGTKNTGGKDVCISCTSVKGTENYISKEFLLNNSNKDDLISIDSCSIELADGTQSTPIRVNVYLTNNEIRPNLSRTTLPLISFKSLDSVDVFVDKGHRMFKNCNISVEQMVAEEVAVMVFELNKRLVNRTGIHTVPNIAWKIIESYWVDELEDSHDKTYLNISMFLEHIKEKLSLNVRRGLEDLFDELSDEQVKLLVENVLKNEKDISKLNEMKEEGSYIKYVDPSFLLRIFDIRPNLYFDGKVWDVSYEDIDNVDDNLKKIVQERTRKFYRNCLEDIVVFSIMKSADSVITKRTRLSLQYLQQKVVD